MRFHIYYCHAYPNIRKRQKSLNNKKVVEKQQKYGNVYSSIAFVEKLQIFSFTDNNKKAWWVLGSH